MRFADCCELVSASGTCVLLAGFYDAFLGDDTLLSCLNLNEIPLRESSIDAFGWDLHSIRGSTIESQYLKLLPFYSSSIPPLSGDWLA